MNTVKVEYSGGLDYECGDLFREPQSGILYLLVFDSMGYAAIMLRTGESWNGGQDTRHEAVKGLEFFGRDRTITIS